MLEHVKAQPKLLLARRKRLKEYIMAEENKRVKRRNKKNISSGIAHVNSTFNNTMITISDENGNTISWSSAGLMGFKGSRTVSYTHLTLPTN